MKQSNPLVPFKNVLIISDIEGSSGCWNYQASCFLTKQWRDACMDMSRDTNAVVTALFNSGVKRIIIKDFHRTGYNLLPEMIDSRAIINYGYHRGPVLGIGDPLDAEAVMMIGMHSASGSTGFLAHTLTSRISSLIVNGHLMSEVELFAASLAPYGVRPIFFSGCPIACEQAKTAIKGIHTYSIDKSRGIRALSVKSWRESLALTAIEALQTARTTPYTPSGPFTAVVDWREGENAAKRLSLRWDLPCKGSKIIIKTHTIHELYLSLVRLCYLTPIKEKFFPLSLFIYRLIGKAGLFWVRRSI